MWIEGTVILVAALLFGCGFMATFLGYLARWPGSPPEDRHDDSAAVLRAFVRASGQLTRYGPPTLAAGTLLMVFARLVIVP